MSLDPDAEEFIESWAQEFPAGSRYQLIIHLQQPAKEADPGALLGFLEKQEFKSLLARVRARLGEEGHLVDHVTETKQQSRPDAAAVGARISGG